MRSIPSPNLFPRFPPYRGRFTDHQNTFETTEEPDYLVELSNDAAVSVLQSKEWFVWDDDSKPLLAGTSLVFRIQWEVSFKDRTSYRDVSVSGDIFVPDQLKRLVKVGSVDFQQDNCKGNPVLAYLQRHGSPQGLSTPLANNDYSLTSPTGTVFNAPLSNESYSKVSGDFNPIHVNPYFANYADLPGTITHGLWTSAATRRYIETVVAQGHPERVLTYVDVSSCQIIDLQVNSRYDVKFIGMVLPGDELTVTIKHVGMRDGNIVVDVETRNSNGEKVLEGSAQVSQPRTVYVFTGQGSQEPGMGMNLYNASPAARAVWESADAHLLAVYGFSIVEIVKDNPKEKTVHFGGIKGQAIRQRYIDMTYDTMDKDGSIKTLPLFADIDTRTPKYTFRHPTGLLFATQFAQIALVVTEKAAFEDLQVKGFVQRDCAFAGHSLGEYSALASIADVIPVASLVDIVFSRGITMQCAVESDTNGQSNYALSTRAESSRRSATPLFARSLTASL
jgi:fatty acid synthase subunit alpha